jgi:thymidine phosphorylase
VKTGSGAFLPGEAEAVELARTMIGLGEAHGCRTVALLTAMDRPLGRACGNALEVEESIAGLSGEGPADLMEVTYALGVEMLLTAGLARDAADARARLEQSIASGRAREKFGELIEAQGGNPAILDDPAALPQADVIEIFTAPRDGVVARIEPRRIGRAIIELGGGRQKVDDVVDPTVGFVITARPGDVVRAGEPIASIHARTDEAAARAANALKAAITIGESAAPLPLISHRITAAGVERL